MSKCPDRSPIRHKGLTQIDVGSFGNNEHNHGRMVTLSNSSIKPNCLVFSYFSYKIEFFDYLGREKVNDESA